MTDPSNSPESHVEVPAATAWPMVLALGILLAGAGLATSVAFLVVGLAVCGVGLWGWVRQLLPGQGHVREPLLGPAGRPQPVQGQPGTVDQLRPGLPGHRLRLPEKVRPISAGVKGGIAGGLLMPIPALIYGIFSGHGLWFPVNLLAGMVLPGIDNMTVAELEEFSLTLLLVAIFIHATNSVIIGLMYGVLLPTLPPLSGGQLVWGGLLMPLFWTGLSYGLMGIVNPVLQTHVDWPFFILSQFVFGVTASIVVIRSEQVSVPPAGTGRG
jgi:hypothetical protein